MHTCITVVDFDICIHACIYTLGHLGVNMNKQEVLAFIKKHISEIDPFSDDCFYESGYVKGLIDAFYKAGLLTQSEAYELENLLTSRIGGI